MEIMTIITAIIYIVFVIWFISVLNTISRNTARTNETLDRVLRVLEGKPSLDSPGPEISGPGLPIFQAPDEHSTVLYRAPESWALSFGEEENGWFPVEIVGEAPEPVLRKRGWVRESDLECRE